MQIHQVGLTNQHNKIYVLNLTNDYAKWMNAHYSVHNLGITGITYGIKNITTWQFSLILNYSKNHI